MNNEDSSRKLWDWATRFYREHPSMIKVVAELTADNVADGVQHWLDAQFEEDQHAQSNRTSNNR